MPVVDDRHIIDSVHNHCLCIRLIRWFLASLALYLFSLSVNAANLTGISLMPSNPTAGVGEAISFTATGRYDDSSVRPLTPLTISGGGGHICSVQSNGEVQCWGDVIYGRPSGIITAIATASGYSHDCVILADGTVKCWGTNGNGQLGNGSTTDSSTPVFVTGISTATAIAVGWAHSCAVLMDGTVKCWGSSNYGQLGNGSIADAYTPVSVTGINSAIAITAGQYHTCAILANHSVRCWGYDIRGQLGDGGSLVPPYYETTPVSVVGISTAIDLSAGYDHTCAVLDDGSMRCWGDNFSGTLGIGSSSPSYSTTPLAVSGISTATAVAAGQYHSCALLYGGDMQCWGSNSYGALGVGSASGSSNSPVAVANMSTAAIITAGRYNTCALLTDNTIQCWGLHGVDPYNTNLPEQYRPTTVHSLGFATDIIATYNHFCALITDDSIECWGSNQFGELGSDNYGNLYNNFPPTSVTNITNATKIADNSGSTHSCALLDTGAVKCWGQNTYGQLGDGTTTDTFTPVTVNGISTAIAIADGNSHSCAVLTGGTVKCWGQNSSGQLGDGTQTDAHAPVFVSGISTATAISAGSNFTCALLASGGVQCWGYGYEGQLGNGTNNYSVTPVAVSGITTANTISSGASHSCVLLSDNSAQCWGSNIDGQLGDGNHNTFSNTPVVVTGISSAVDIDAGTKHSCAILQGGSVKCWGDDGTSTVSYTPVSVGSLRAAATAITAGNRHSCAIFTDGEGQCWGQSFDSILPSFGDSPAMIISLKDAAGLVWTSSAPSVARIDKNGLLQAIMEGVTYITASYGGYTTGTMVIVGNPPDSDSDGLPDSVDDDDDNDGMPDSYELSQGFNPLNASDASLDADSDGYSNLAEYNAGTDPHDAGSKPRTRFMPWLPLLLD